MDVRICCTRICKHAYTSISIDLYNITVGLQSLLLFTLRPPRKASVKAVVVMTCVLSVVMGRHL